MLIKRNIKTDRGQKHFFRELDFNLRWTFGVLRTQTAVSSRSAAFSSSLLSHHCFPSALQSQTHSVMEAFSSVSPSPFVGSPPLPPPLCPRSDLDKIYLAAGSGTIWLLTSTGSLRNSYCVSATFWAKWNVSSPNLSQMCHVFRYFPQTPVNEKAWKMMSCKTVICSGRIFRL